MMIRRKPPIRANAERDKIIRRGELAHASWIRRHSCAVDGCPARRVQWAHIRDGLPSDAKKGGWGMKPEAAWSVPLCVDHHLEQGQGEPAFNKAHNLIAKAEAYAKASPALKRMKSELASLVPIPE